MAVKHSFNITKSKIKSSFRSDGYNWVLVENNVGEISINQPEFKVGIKKIEVFFNFSNYDYKAYPAWIKSSRFYPDDDKGVLTAVDWRGYDKSYVLDSKDSIDKFLTASKMDPYVFLSTVDSASGTRPGDIGAYESADISECYMNIYYNNSINPIEPNGYTGLTSNSVKFSWIFYPLDAAVQTGYIIQALINGGNEWITVVDNSGVDTSYMMPSNKLSQGLWSWRVMLKTTQGNTVWSEPCNFTLKGQPTIENINILGQEWERDIVVNWRSTYQVGYEYELYYNNEKIKVGSGGFESEFIIPANTFDGSLTSSVRIRVNNKFNDEIIWSEWKEKTIALKDISATISNLIMNGEYWERPISISWQSVDQQQFKIEAFKDNVVVKSYVGESDKSYIIAPDELNAGKYTFKVSVAYANRFINSQSRDVELKDVKAEVDEFSLSGSNIDLPLSMNWVSKNQEKWEVKVLLGQVEKLSYSGLIETSNDIPVGAINEIGLYTFMMRVAFRNRWSEWKYFDKALTETLPVIGILEPDGRILDNDSPIRVYWTSINQSRWELSVNGNAFSGTDETEQLISSGTLATGRAAIKLTIYLDISGKEKIAMKNVEFIVRGRPTAPTITSGYLFDNNRPTFSWDTRDQNSFTIEVSDINNDIIYNTGWINGLIVTHKMKSYLKDGYYTVSIKVKNIYAEESDWARKQFNVSTTKGEDIILSAVNNETVNILEWDSSGYDTYYVFRNNDMIAKTNGYMYADYTAHASSNYFIRGVNDLDVFNDSNHELLNVKFDFPVLSIGNSNIISLIYRNGLSDISIGYNPMSNKVFYSGRKSPVVVNGEHDDYSYSIDYSDISSDSYFRVLNMILTKKPILYRSNRYKIWLTFDNVSIVDNCNDIIYSLDGYKIDYSEVIEYD